MATDNTFKIMSYNTLTQLMMTRARYPTNGSIINWKKRFPMLRDEIKTYRPDLLFLQEVDDFKIHDWNSLLYELQMNSKICFYPGKSHGILIAWSESLFELQESQTIYYDETNDIPIQDAHSSHVGLILALRSRRSSETIISATTHLTWRPQCCYERLRQFLMLLRGVKQLQEKFKTRHTVIGGDFNSSVGRPCHRFAVDHYLTEETKQKLQRSINQTALVGSDALMRIEMAAKSISCDLRSCYLEILGQEPDFTNWTDNFRETLDYIFVSESFHISAVLSLPSAKEMSPEPSSLPRMWGKTGYPSDHLAIMAIVYPKQAFETAITSLSLA